MTEPQTSYESILNLNGRPEVRTYTAEIRNTITIDDKVEQTTVVLYFTLQYLGTTKEGNLKYKSSIQKRLFLDEKQMPVFKPSKLQKMALDVAQINDELIFEVTKQYKLVGIINTDEVQEKWRSVKDVVQSIFSDMGPMVDDFDWQMQTENIQHIFTRDVFYNFFFANIFYQEFDTKKSLRHEKVLSNGIHNLNIPIIETKTITKEDDYFRNITISVAAALDAENERFPIAKINRFLGDVLQSTGDEDDLDFTYKGHYKVRPNVGLIDSGELGYGFVIGDLYSKTVSINFKLEEDEQ